MLRKMLLIASAIAIPLGATAVTTGITAVAESGTAGATPLAITCKVTSGTVSFASPGLSTNGSFQAAPTSTSTTTSVKYKCTPPAASVVGTTKPLAIVTPATQCTAANVPVPGCVVGQYNYSNEGSFASNAGTLWSEIGTLSIKIGTVNYKATLQSSTLATTCVAGEAGFNLKGKLSAPTAHAGETMKLTVCLSGDSGPGTTGNFVSDLASHTGTIATATIAADSKAKIS